MELGAGRGYWAAQLSREGMSIEAYDVAPPDKVENMSFPSRGGVWHHVGERVDQVDRSADVLFLCWPPGWGDTMASTALAGFEKANGRRLIFMGQPRGGMTGDDAFFDALADRWELVAEDARFVSRWNLADVARGWVRR